MEPSSSDSAAGTDHRRGNSEMVSSVISVVDDQYRLDIEEVFVDCLLRMLNTHEHIDRNLFSLRQKNDKTSDERADLIGF